MPTPYQIFFSLTPYMQDTEVLYTECTEKILSRYGQTYEWSLKSRIMGRPPMECARIVVEDLSFPKNSTRSFTACCRTCFPMQGLCLVCAKCLSNYVKHGLHCFIKQCDTIVYTIGNHTYFRLPPNSDLLWMNASVTLATVNQTSYASTSIQVLPGKLVVTSTNSLQKRLSAELGSYRK